MVSGLLTGVMVGGMRHGALDQCGSPNHTHAQTCTYTHGYRVTSRWLHMNHTASRDTFSRTRISHTPTHTHLRKRQATLGICGFVLISEMIVGQHFWIKCLTNKYHANTNSYIDCQTATFLFFFLITHFCQVQATGDDS